MFTRVQPKLSMLEHKFIPGTPSNKFLWMFGSISSSNTNIWNHPIEFQLKQSLLFMFFKSFQAQRFSTKMPVNCFGQNPPKKNPKAPWKPKTSNKEQVGNSIYHPKFMSRWYQEDLMLEPFHMLLPSLLPMGVYFVVFFLGGGRIHFIQPQSSNWIEFPQVLLTVWCPKTRGAKTLLKMPGFQLLTSTGDRRISEPSTVGSKNKEPYNSTVVDRDGSTGPCPGCYKGHRT